MKVIVLLAGYGTRMRPHTWSRPKPLLKVAGNTVVGHVLDQMREITTGEVIFVVGYGGDQIESWIRENYSHLDTHFVVQEEALGQAHAVWLCDEFLDDSDVVVAFGDGIIEADYENLPDPAAEVMMVMLPNSLRNHPQPNTSWQSLESTGFVTDGNCLRLPTPSSSPAAKRWANTLWSTRIKSC